MMEQAIKDFAKQFRFKPEIKNADRYSPTGRFIVCGMGGSHLAADILQSIEPKIDLAIRRDYGLPERTDGATVVVSSYSGNTEEALDAYEQVRQHGLPMLAIAVGGKLIEQALRDNVPYIQLPDTGIQPRSALGFSFLALLKTCGLDERLKEAAKAERTVLWTIQPVRSWQKNSKAKCRSSTLQPATRPLPITGKSSSTKRANCRRS